MHLFEQKGNYYESVPQKNMRTDIQALRCLAVVMVVLFHLDIEFFKGGFIGVDIFFVVSGYLVVGSIFNGLMNDKFDYGIFVANRIKRLFPASFICLVFITLLFLIFPTIQKESGNQGWIDLIWASGHGANIKFFINQNQYFRSDNTVSFMLHFWSLALEEQFYLIIPLLLLGYWKLASVFAKEKSHKMAGLTLWTLVLTLTSMILCMLPVLSSSQKFFMLYTRVWEFLFGSMVSLYQEDITRMKIHIHEYFVVILQSLCFLGLGLFSVFTPSENYPNYITLSVVIITCVTISLDSPIDNNIITFIGNWSYSIYLYHFPLIQLFKYVSISNNSKIVCVILLTFLFGILSYYIVEQEFLKINIPPVGWYIILIFLSISLSLAAWFLFSPPLFVFSTNIHTSKSYINESTRYHSANITLEEIKLLKYNAQIAAHTGVLSQRISTYFQGDGLHYINLSYIQSANHNEYNGCILLYGDSNVMQWWGAIVELSKTIKYPNVFTAASFDHHNGKLIYDLDEAEYYITQSLIHKEYQKCTKVISIFSRVSIDIWDYSTENLIKLNESITRLTTHFSQKGHAVVIQSLPRLPSAYNPNICLVDEILTKTIDFHEKCSINKTIGVFKYSNFFNPPAPKVSVLDMNKYICSKERCFPNYKDVPIYMDESHICEAMVTLLTPTFVNEILELTKI